MVRLDAWVGCTSFVWGRVSSELDPKYLDFIFVKNDKYFLIATVPYVGSISGEVDICMYPIMSLQRTIAGFTSHTSLQDSSACIQFRI